MNLKSNILIVEDNPGDVRLIQEILNDVDISYNLYFASDGDVALQMLKREGVYCDVPRPDLILLDMNLPKKDGKEVIDDIKQYDRLNNIRLNDIPIIILTNSISDIKNDPYVKLADAALLKSPNLEGFEKIANCIQNVLSKIKK
jgi:two-component system response regulator